MNHLSASLQDASAVSLHDVAAAVESLSRALAPLGEAPRPLHSPANSNDERPGGVVQAEIEPARSRSGAAETALERAEHKRPDTATFLAQIFEGEVDGPQHQDGGTSSSSAPLILTRPLSRRTLPFAHRRELMREMEDLRDELHDGGQSQQWEVHEQIGKGGYGVVYKVRAPVPSDDLVSISY